MKRIRWVAPKASGRRVGFARVVHEVKEGKGVKAFPGFYLKDDHEVDLELGSVIVQVAPMGSVKNCWQEASIATVTEKGLEFLDETWDWRKEFPSIKDEVSKRLYDKNKSTTDTEAVYCAQKPISLIPGDIITAYKVTSPMDREEGKWGGTQVLGTFLTKSEAERVGKGSGVFGADADIVETTAVAAEDGNIYECGNVIDSYDLKQSLPKIRESAKNILNRWNNNYLEQELAEAAAFDLIRQIANIPK